MHALYLGGVYISIANGLPAALSALIVGLQPLLTSTIANRLLGERVVARQWGGLLLGIAGVYLVVQDKATTGGATPLAWVAALVALLSITFGTIYQKRFGSGIDWRPGMLIQYAAAGILFALGAMAFETRIVHWTPEFLFALCWLVIRAVVRRHLATLFPHKPVCGDASSESVLPHSAGDGFNGMGTFQ